MANLTVWKVVLLVLHLVLVLVQEQHESVPLLLAGLVQDVVQVSHEVLATSLFLLQGVELRDESS